MDETVIKAMKRWPDVPAAFGWLRLDRRGRWYLIDRNVPGFNEQEHGAGSLISSEPINEFINRNYSCDQQGRWFWQNGPQKAYANLDLAPLILRVITGSKGQALLTHTGYPVNEVTAAYTSAEGSLFVQTDLGPGAIHDMDLAGLQLTETHVQIGLAQLPLIPMNQCAAQTLGFMSQPQPA